MVSQEQAYTFFDIEQVCHREKVHKRSWYYFHRRLSIPLTWTAYRLRLSPNLVSFAMLVVGLAGNMALASTERPINILGLGLVYVAFLLDKVDGDLARLQRRTGSQAMILDYAYHRLTLFTFYGALGVHSYLISGAPVGLIAGSLAGFLANYVQDAQVYPYRIYAQKVLCSREGWSIGPLVPERRRELRESPWKMIKLFTSQLLLLVPVCVLLCWRPYWLDEFLLTATAALTILIAVQHLIFFHGGMEAELAYIDAFVRKPDPCDLSTSECLKSASRSNPMLHVYE
jgi:phosphatidylglycerophosphate synthase